MTVMFSAVDTTRDDDQIDAEQLLADGLRVDAPVSAGDLDALADAVGVLVSSDWQVR
jgi:hypothetical protein